MAAARDPSPSSTLAAREAASETAGEPTLPSNGSTTETDRETYDKRDDKDDRDDSDDTEKGYEDRGIVELDQAGTKRRIRVVVEDETGKERLKDVGSGEYTEPRWRHSLPFMKPKHPPPPAPLSMDAPPVTPEVSANWLSYMTFNWISPMMALGAARTLEASDMYKMDDKRSAGRLAQNLMSNYERRKEKAAAYNKKLEDPNTPLPFPQRITYPILPHREKREADFRNNKGQKKPSLAWALSDTFGMSFWSAGIIKVFGDTSTACSTLIIRALIKWATQWEYARKGKPGVEYPHIGQGVGFAIGLFCLLTFGSFCMHHYFYRSMGVGVLTRSALISAIYHHSLRLTQKARGEHPNGKIVNHISTDTARIDFCAGFAHIAWTAPVQFVVICVILIVQIGYSALPGLAFLLIMAPGQTVMMRKLFALRKKSMIWTDKRAKLLQEILGGMRIVKFMSWEMPFLKRLGAIRGMELKYLRQLLIQRSGMMAYAMSLPVLGTILSFITYSLTSHNLEPATIFTVVSLFQMTRMPLLMFPMCLSSLADAINALGRIQVLLDAEVNTDEKITDYDMKDAVVIDHASFTWDAAPPVEDAVAKLEAKLVAAQAKQDRAGRKEKKEKAHKARKGDKSGATTPAPAKTPKKSGAVTPVVEAEVDVQKDIFKLQDISVRIPQGSLTAIVGAIGSGKSSLLQGLMGEMRRTAGSVKFNGSTSLCAQTPWIQNATVRENILFGQPWNEERYWAAVKNSSLEPDLVLLEDGDGTEIGEKGITLSGGQKQRVNIARAIYFDADIIALDDPLSALDAGVGKAIFHNAILGALHGKTRILVTHALHFLPFVDNIIVLDNGRISEVGSYKDLVSTPNGSFARLISEFGAVDADDKEAGDEEGAIEQDNEDKAKPIPRSEMVARKGGAISLMQTEERNEGSIAGGTWGGYIKAGRGVIMIPTLLFCVSLAQVFTIVTSYWLLWWQQGHWGLSNNLFMGIYACLGIGSAISMFLMGFSNSMFTYFASVRLHALAVRRVMFSPQAFFDTTPLGRIMNRFSKDIDTVDNTLSDALRMAISTCAQILGAVILLAIISPWFLIAVAVVLFLYWHCAMYYRRSSREFKRIDSILRSSLYAHFSESLSGISTIRAYGEGKRFEDENVRRMDIENRAYYMTIINQRWLGLRLDILGSLLSFAVALIVVFNHKVGGAQSGLGLSTMVTVQQSFTWLVRQLAEVENDMVGAERILYYANELDQEAPQEVIEKKPPPEWPSAGAIEFNDVYMKYRPELPDVLKGLTLSIAANEKIGIVGRTGAGKSSIMVSLFRMAELHAGSIVIDGVDISKIGLHDLRSRISIIPQDPLLFSGTLRSNIDPFNTKTDAELYDALRRAHLIPATAVYAAETTEGPDGEKETALMNVNQGSRFTLDYQVEEEGGNLSVGERSLVSLARALVRDPKVLVLDEATASVDLETDARIQETIRQEFGNKTLLCIAHRLRTILSYDKILVMAEGRVEEFDTPMNLFNGGGHFREMCDKSGIGIDAITAASQVRFESIQAASPKVQTAQIAPDNTPGYDVNEKAQ